ncbi:hypothetical protein V8G54_011524 [Vigna mungo]|uniref:Uncharacterized protein n=1 Tax=Vigna mungo TaxID=3915 RepID=A0AAQ3NT32_VIGMU
MNHSKDNNGEINFFNLESVIDAYDRVLAKCARLSKICHVLKMQTKKKLTENNEKSKELISCKEETRELQVSISKIKVKMVISKREKNKLALRHEKFVKYIKIAKDTKCLKLLTRKNNALVEELRKIYGDNKGLKMLIRKG